MHRSTKYLVTALLVGVISLFLFLTEGNSYKNTVKNEQIYRSSDWKNPYQLNSKNPGGLYLFSSLLRSYISKKNHIIQFYKPDYIK